MLTCPAVDASVEWAGCRCTVAAGLDSIASLWTASFAGALVAAAADFAVFTAAWWFRLGEAGCDAAGKPDGHAAAELLAGPSDICEIFLVSDEGDVERCGTAAAA